MDRQFSEAPPRDRTPSPLFAQENLLASVAHELRNPLQSIMSWAQLLALTDIEPAQRQRAVESILRSVELQSRLISDLLDLSRISSGKLHLELARVDVNEVVDRAVESVALSVQARGLRLQQSGCDTPVWVLGDRNRLEQVVWNLLSNAVKFTPKGGRIDVAIEMIDRDVRIVVQDDGGGIEPGLLPYVFDPYAQDEVVARSDSNREGLGLGLAIVRHIVTGHAGTVSAESAGKNRGARFTVTLPQSLGNSTN